MQVLKSSFSESDGKYHFEENFSKNKTVKIAIQFQNLWIVIFHQDFQFTSTVSFQTRKIAYYNVGNPFFNIFTAIQPIFLAEAKVSLCHSWMDRNCKLSKFLLFKIGNIFKAIQDSFSDSIEKESKEKDHEIIEVESSSHLKAIAVVIEIKFLLAMFNEDLSSQDRLIRLENLLFHPCIKNSARIALEQFHVAEEYFDKGEFQKAFSIFFKVLQNPLLFRFLKKGGVNKLLVLLFEKQVECPDKMRVVNLLDEVKNLCKYDEDFSITLLYNIEKILREINYFDHCDRIWEIDYYLACHENVPRDIKEYAQIQLAISSLHYRTKEIDANQLKEWLINLGQNALNSKNRIFANFYLGVLCFSAQEKAEEYFLDVRNSKNCPEPYQTLADVYRCFILIEENNIPDFNHIKEFFEKALLDKKILLIDKSRITLYLAKIHQLSPSTNNKIKAASLFLEMVKYPDNKIYAEDKIRAIVFLSTSVLQGFVKGLDVSQTAEWLQKVIKHPSLKKNELIVAKFNLARLRRANLTEIISRDTAISYLREVIESKILLPSDEMTAKLELSLFLREGGANVKEAIKLLQEVITDKNSEEENKLRAKLALAILSYINKAQRDEAISYLKEIIEKNLLIPSDQMAAKLFWALYLQEGPNFEEAISLFQEVIKDKNTEEQFKLLAMLSLSILSYKGKAEKISRDEVISYLKEVILKDALQNIDQLEAKRMLAQIYEAENLKEAIKLYQDIIDNKDSLEWQRQFAMLKLIVIRKKNKEVMSLDKAISYLEVIVSSHVLHLNDRTFSKIILSACYYAKNEPIFDKKAFLLMEQLLSDPTIDQLEKEQIYAWALQLRAQNRLNLQDNEILAAMNRLIESRSVNDKTEWLKLKVKSRINNQTEQITHKMALEILKQLWFTKAAQITYFAILSLGLKVLSNYLAITLRAIFTRCVPIRV